MISYQFSYRHVTPLHELYEALLQFYVTTYIYDVYQPTTPICQRVGLYCIIPYISQKEGHLQLYKDNIIL